MAQWRLGSRPPYLAMGDGVARRGARPRIDLLLGSAHGEAPNERSVTTSGLKRMMNIIMGDATAHISTVSDEGVPAWTRYPGDLDNRLVGNGDLVLDMADNSSADKFVASGILDKWAEALDFSLEGIDRQTAFYALSSSTLLREWEESGGPEHLRIRVHRDFVVHVLVESFDGPFYDKPDFDEAVSRRLGPKATWAYVR